ncbi:M48 family metalloprotease [Kineobactrum salinum]|uniref:M48 family metalloprotease n=1 Tax=Kineobactrum salinum TaxID=2708301 RepID=A0A6C0U1P2_9GAMM|nr:M48 family metalloprotease [Kineobactrum salinum]QIB66030.1 M48 family metalloprotease [Kineobactrum salinum]
MIRSPLLLLTAIALITLGLASGCASNPATGGADVVVMSQGKEVRIGEEMHAEILKEGGLYEDAELQAYVDRVGQRLAANSDRPDMQFTFTVIDSPDLNAFATPGGYVYINRGLLSYLDNEAELAGVLAHEIAHITARHAARQQSASITNKVLAVTAGVLTGSRQIMDSAAMYGTELVRGYGREHELEADGLGAKYMYLSGYEPDALLEVIAVLKDQEQFQRVRARSSGKPAGTYHGLYATHPRNDQRLQTVVRAANELGAGEPLEDPSVPGEFQRRTDGLPWGPASKREEGRYYHSKLEFSFAHPPDWRVRSSSSAIIASAPDGSATLTLTLRQPDPAQSPREALEAAASGALSEGLELDQAGLKGYSAVASNDADARRLAVVNHNWQYLFEGKAEDFAAADGTLLEIIQSFRPLHPQEREVASGRHLRYIQVPRGATMASLAASSRIPDAEAQLRLLNGLYPRGEPRVGDWVKVIQ